MLKNKELRESENAVFVVWKQKMRKKDEKVCVRL